jgi:hypothetical protein
MGNLVDVMDRPNIGLQSAETVFLDKKAYLIPQIYGKLIEEEYQEIILDELAFSEFEMKLMESPIAINPDDKPKGEIFQSTARAYFAFLDLTNRDLVRPEVGSRLQITLTTFAPNNSKEATETLDTSSDTDSKTSPDRDQKDAIDQDIPTPDDIEGLGDEDEYNVFDTESDNQHPPYEWFATVLEPTAITPTGSLTIMLERRRDPSFHGPRHLRPFVNYALPTVNYRVAESEEHSSKC